MSAEMSMSDTVTLLVPFRIMRRGGRKEMVLPSSASEGGSQLRRIDNTLIKALARAFRWKRMLESGEFATVAELARYEGITLSYVTRTLQLTRLAPDLIEAILDGRQDPSLPAEVLRATLPDIWSDQRHVLASYDSFPSASVSADRKRQKSA